MISQSSISRSNALILGECCICRQRITKQEEAIKCPHCKNEYHHKHLNIWLRIKQNCPICQVSLKITSMKNRTLTKKRLPKSITKISKFPRKSDFIIIHCSQCQNTWTSKHWEIPTRCQYCYSQIHRINPISRKNEILIFPNDRETFRNKKKRMNFKERSDTAQFRKLKRLEHQKRIRQRKFQQEKNEYEFLKKRQSDLFLEKMKREELQQIDSDLMELTSHIKNGMNRNQNSKTMHRIRYVCIVILLMLIFHFTLLISILF